MPHLFCRVNYRLLRKHSSYAKYGHHLSWVCLFVSPSRPHVFFSYSLISPALNKMTARWNSNASVAALSFLVLCYIIWTAIRASLAVPSLSPLAMQTHARFYNSQHSWRKRYLLQEYVVTSLFQGTSQDMCQPSCNFDTHSGRTQCHSSACHRKEFFNSCIHTKVRFIFSIWESWKSNPVLLPSQLCHHMAQCLRGWRTASFSW